MRVRIRGLNIRRAKGRWYVGIRGGKSLVKGFNGTREDLQKYMSTPEFMMKLALARKVGNSFEPDTLGGLIEWFKSETTRWQRLSPSTQSDYEKKFAWIGADLHYPADQIDTYGIVNIRNRAAKEKWPRFADILVSALSSVFTEAVLAGKTPVNPCRGVPRLNITDPNANREWPQEAQRTAFDNAPIPVLLPMLIARYAGFRGKDICSLKWDAYTGHSLRIMASKNRVLYEVPVLPSQPLKSALDTARKDAQSIRICVTARGQPWANEQSMQGAVSRYLRNHVEDGLTLHGLRVTYAAQFRRLGMNDNEVADLIGDKSTAMGAHYTRHVDSQNAIDKGFKLLQERTK